MPPAVLGQRTATKTDTMINQPKKIYLQVGDTFDGDMTDYDFKQLSEVTWCDERIWKTDLEYISADSVRDLLGRWKKHAAEFREQWPGENVAPNTIEVLIEAIENELK